MPTFRLNKLVRTGLPKIFEDLGEVAEIKELHGAELEKALIAKLSEEVKELEGEDLLDQKELADVLQVIRDAALVSGSNFNELEALRIEREKDRGSMVVIDKQGRPTGYYVSRVVCKEGDEWVDYYRKEPNRFPEEVDNDEL